MSVDEEFNHYIAHLSEELGHADCHAGLSGYCTGLMLPLSRKSVEPMAARVDPLHASARHQAPHHFVAKSEWSDSTVMARVRDWVIPGLGLDSGRYWIIDDTGFPKKGKHSVGVARRYCGQLGKKDNCHVAVSLSLASAQGSLSIAYQPYQSALRNPSNPHECWLLRANAVPQNSQEQQNTHSEPESFYGILKGQPMTDDVLRSRLDQMIDHSHPLAALASRLPWEKMESRVAPQFTHKERPLQQVQEAPDLGGPVVRISGGKASNAGRPRLAMRLMIALTLLKNSFDLSDEELVQRFAKNVYWQHFAGLEYF